MLVGWLSPRTLPCLPSQPPPLPPWALISAVPLINSAGLSIVRGWCFVRCLVLSFSCFLRFYYLVRSLRKCTVNSVYVKPSLLHLNLSWFNPSKGPKVTKEYAKPDLGPNQPSSIAPMHVQTHTLTHALSLTCTPLQYEALAPDILPLELLHSSEFLENVRHSMISCALQVEVFVMDLSGPEISRLSLEVERPLFYHLLVKHWIGNL